MPKINSLSFLILLFIVPIYCGPAFGQNQERSFDEIVSSWKNFVGTVETNQFIDAKAGALSEVGVDTTEDTKILLLPYELIENERVISELQSGYLNGFKDSLEILQIANKRPESGKKSPVDVARNIVAENKRKLGFLVAFES